MQQNNLKREALEYHARERRGKVEVVPTKPYSTQRDLSLAYSPGVGGRGLFARVPLERGQAICEYGGPRLPMSLQSGDGSYVLQLPRTRIIIDGNCDNLPGEYDVPRCSAIFANHSSEPNAALEHWPHLGADEFELSGS